MNRPDNDRLNPLEKRYASTSQVAQALGVSVTTVKRWVDTGILPAYKTAGGHRKLLMADVLRLTREGGLPQADLSRLDPRIIQQDSPSPAQLCNTLSVALRDADITLARSIIFSAYQSGLPIETIADQIISPVMSQIGHDWMIGRLDVLHEHRATQICTSVLYELKATLEANAERDRPVAVGGSPENDHYLLANLLAQMTLLDAGWHAINLGPHTPIASFRLALTELRPQIVWLSINHLADPERFLAEYTEFYREAGRYGVAVAVGGRGLTAELRTTMPYTTYGDGLTQLAAFARTLNKRPQRPRRGRPIGSTNRNKQFRSTQSDLLLRDGQSLNGVNSTEPTDDKPNSGG
jgi:excisionase family DNA binding protein